MFRAALRPSLASFRTLPTGANLARRFISDDVRSKLQTQVKEKPVVLYMKGTPDVPQCGFSRAVVTVLYDVYKVPNDKIQTHDVLANQELRNSIKEFSDWPTIPQVYVGGEFVGGCDIVLQMHKTGELETLLETNEVIPKAEAPKAEAPPS